MCTQYHVFPASSTFVIVVLLWGLNMQVSVENVSKVERRLTIVVPVAKVEEAYNLQIDRFAKTANIKGFRPGKAPLSYIRQRFGDDARREALNEVIQQSFDQAITENKLHPVSRPHIEPRIMAPDQPLEYIASFEVLPEIASMKHEIKTIEKPVVEITQEDLDTVLKQLLKQYTKWNMVERESRTGDRIVIDYYPIYEGNADLEHKIERFPLELGGKVMIPGFEEGLLGAKAGEERKLNLSYPENFNVPERAGKPVDFVVNIKQVFEGQAPELNNSFIEKLGVKSGLLEDLHTQVRQTLEMERNRLVREKLKEQVFRDLLEQNPLDVPASMIAQEAKNIHDEIYQHQHHDHSQHSDHEMATFNDIAKKRVALGLLIAEFAKQQQLKADRNRVMARIAEIAAAYESPKEVIEWLSSDERRAGIEAQVMEDQVMDKLMEAATITEKPMSYSDLKGLK